MNATLHFAGAMPMTGLNDQGFATRFDSSLDHGGSGTAPTPMEVLLQSLAACSAVDVISIVKKKRRQIDHLSIEIAGDRAETHPRVFTRISLRYVLTSPDAELTDLESAVYLSMQTYCSVSAMIKKSGCDVTWTSEIVRSPASDKPLQPSAYDTTSNA
ncbi:MAG: OsmC family protein [Rhizobacter sp.]|nr:OsmC family protein [Chlorobiales bacterium]